MKFRIEDIIVGDEVCFYSTINKNNHDDHWTVTGIEGELIMIEYNKDGIIDYTTLHNNEVVSHLPTSDKRKIE